MATTVILGGGVGGLVAANMLRRRLDQSHRVVLVEREAQHVFTPSFLWMMLGRRQPRHISRDFGRLARKGIEVLQDDVRAIDSARRIVRTERREVSSDFVVVALGAEGWRGGIPGLAEEGYDINVLDDVLRLRDALAGFRGGRVVVLVAGLPFRCPAAPYETAMLIEASLRERRLRERSEVDVYTPETLPMPVAGKAMGEAIKGMVEGKGIGFHGQHKLSAVDPGRRELTFENGARANYDLLVLTPPHRCPAVVKEAGLAGDSGWVAVDPGTLATTHERVFAIGDVTAIKLPVGLMLPKAGVFAHHQAEAVAENIAAAITGRAAHQRFDGSGY
ncbi:MAG: FAD-dependent oxidoreductase [Candidatus Rokubacteria bacterium]|nr:FAD-dependent oxidoreductase [Candidatus Rokubacteria bacterium]MBI3826076.1 FAD-dependent oxidoreductase [Candidatus Rokubacteria bacterium]